MRLPPWLYEQASGWRKAIRAHPGTRFGLFHDDRHVFTAALFAAWAEGRQVVLPGDNLPHTVEALRPHVDALIGDFPAATLSPGAPSDFTWEALDRELEGLVVFTSGSTGQPTAIPKRLRQLLDEVATQERTFGERFGRDAVVFSTVSHQHIYGLLCSVLGPLHAGRALTQRRMEFPEQLEVVLAPQPCVLITSPAHLKRLPGERPWQTQLRAVFSSGGPLPPEGAARARAVLGLQPIEIYGSSETGGIAWREGSSAPWTPFSGVELRRAETGLLEVRGPHLPGAEWFTTADRVELDGAHLTLRGRADRVAKIEEKRVSLELIERAAVSTGLLSEARVVVLEGPRVVLGLVGVPSPGGRALERKALIDRVRERLADAVERVAIPRRWRFVGALPVDAQGKVTDAALRAAFDEPAPGPAAAPAPAAEAVHHRWLPEVRWGERTATRAELELTLTPDLQVLDGHFPGAPVVPGVAQVTWAVEWGRQVFGLRGGLVRLEVLKFQALLLPGHEAKLALDWSPEKSTLSFRYSSPSAVYSSGRVVLSA